MIFIQVHAFEGVKYRPFLPGLICYITWSVGTLTTLETTRMATTQNYFCKKKI